MSNYSKLFLKPFVGGLNTELSQVEDALLYTSDELNCTILTEGMRGRRYGMNVERDGQFFNTGQSATTFSGFFWKNVGKTTTDFIVYQVDNILHFYDGSIKPYSTKKLTATVNLSAYITDINNFYNYPVRFSTGDGKLMVVSKYMKAVYISYDFDALIFNVEEVKLKYRDLEGVDDRLKIDEQPSTLSNEHKYNLLNQGWSLDDIEQFHSDKTRYPSNNLQWFLGKDSSGAYNTEELLKKYFGNTPAPKGHFILDYFDRNRGAASGIFAKGAREAVYNYDRVLGYYNGYLWYYPCKEFSVVFPSSEGTAKSLQLNFTKCQGGYSLGNWRGTVNIYIYGLDSSNKWRTVYSDTHLFEMPEKYLVSFTNNTKYKQYKVEVKFPVSGNDYSYPGRINLVASLAMSEDGDPFPFTHGLDRITDVAYMSGKYFYLTGDTVLFSQTITEDNKGYDECYQDADPTSEEISDIVPTDGGYVKFQTMGDGMALKVFNRGVLVFGRDVVYGLISPLDGRFTATEYDTVELSRAGLIGIESVVSVADRVFYWSPLGIFSIGVNQQTGNTMVAENISSTTIQTFYNNIPKFSKENCKAAFDYVNNRIYWFYPTSPDNRTCLDGVLMYDLNYNAFCPFKISSGGCITAVFETVNSSEIQPTLFLRAGGKRIIAGDNCVITNEQENKYNRFVAIQHCILTDEGISFGDFNSREFIDWDTSSYDSYLVSRPITMGDTYYNKQAPILQTLFKRTEEGKLIPKDSYIAQSGAYIRMRWGWSLNDRSNRWDIEQNGYRPQKDFMQDEYVESRLHVRGRGKSFQVEVRNDANKDMRLSGMNLMVRV